MVRGTEKVSHCLIDRRAVPCGDQDTAVLHPAADPENGVTPQKQ